MNSIQKLGQNTTIQRVQNVSPVRQQYLNTEQQSTISFKGRSLKRKRAPKTFGEAVEKFLLKMFKRFLYFFSGSL